MAFRAQLAILLLALLSACAAPRGRVQLDTGEGPPIEYSPPSPVRAVAVGAGAFEKALTELILNAPLRLRASRPGNWVRASYPTSDADSRWQRVTDRGFGGFCEPGPRSGDCISLLEDVMGLSDWDKLGVALALSLEPLKESIARAVEDTLAPQLFYSVIATGLVTWAALAANPEPAFTKGAALISVLLLLYLGAETFLELVEASQDLKLATDQATTWEELDASGQRFAARVGPSIARVLVLAVTVAVSHGMTGGASLLAARLSTLPNFPGGAAGASRIGVHVASLEQVRAVSVSGGVITLALPSTAVAMVAKGSGAPPAGGVRSWNSFSALKRARGPAGPGKQWHHIVEQTDGNVQRFGPQSLHNTENVIAIDETIHQQISRYYSSKDLVTTGGQMTVRQWLRGQSFQAQRDFGMRILMRYGVTP
ncbi:SitA5 family polymorphic toxin [Corallococcus caeni]